MRGGLLFEKDLVANFNEIIECDIMCGCKNKNHRIEILYLLVGHDSFIIANFLLRILYYPRRKKSLYHFLSSENLNIIKFQNF